MKKLVLIICAVFIVFTATAKDPVAPANMSATAKAQFKAALGLNDTIPFSSIAYTKEYVDSIKYNLQKGKFDGQIKRLTGIDIISPVAAWTTLNGTLALTDGYSYFVLYEVTDTIVVNTFQYILSTAGNFTADNYNGIALYSYNKSTKAYAKIVETANDATIWTQTANTLCTKTFADQTLNPGFYAVAMNYNCSGTATTTPSITTFGTLSSVVGLIYGHWLVGVRTSQTALPSSEAYANLFGIGQIVGIILK